MEKQIIELTEKDYSVEEVAKELDVSVEVVEEILNKQGVNMREMVINEELEIKEEENQSKFYDIIDIEREFDLLDPNSIRKMITVSDDKKLYLCGDLVDPRLSKKGSIYFVVKGNYIKNKLINNLLKTKLVEIQFKIIDHINDLPSYTVSLCKSTLSNREFIIWKSKRDNLVHIIMEKEKGLDRLKEQMSLIEYKKLKEELEYRKNLLVDPVDVEEDEIYGSQEPELFIERTEELYELLKVVKELKSRKLSFEERELLKEINSEIETLI